VTRRVRTPRSRPSRIGWKVEKGHERGGRPRQRARDQQPAADLGGDRKDDQPARSGPARHEIRVADHESRGDRGHRRGGGGAAEPAGGPSQVAPALAQQEEKARVGDAGADAVARSRGRVAPVGVLSDDARDQEDATRGEETRAGELRAKDPGEQRQDHDLGIGEDRREARADVLDRGVPEDPVGGEEDTRDQRRPPFAPGPRAEAAVIALVLENAIAAAPLAPAGARGHAAVSRRRRAVDRSSRGGHSSGPRAGAAGSLAAALDRLLARGSCGGARNCWNIAHIPCAGSDPNAGGS
jgi:hypothetical protein